MTPWLLNSAWMWQCGAAARQLRYALRHVRRTQESVLLRIVRQNRASDFGRRHRFADIRSIAEFQSRVPCTDYEGQRNAMDRIAAGQQRVLTAEPVRLLEPTGGSSGAAKWIPYTKSLRDEFRRAIAAWIWDAFRRYPDARRGRAYWCLTPMGQRPKCTGGGVPIGFESDSEYLGGWQRWAAARLSVVPPALAKLQSLENARYATLCYLLASDDLALISVWSPLFLTALLDLVPQWADSLCDDVAAGRVRLPEPTAEAANLELPFRVDRQRAVVLRRLFETRPFTGDTWRRCWPRLALVSCWGDAASEAYLPQVRSLLPQAAVQPKGLLATEGVVTIPWGEGPGGVLALRSHFFEFQPLAAPGVGPVTSAPPRLAHELSVGGRYRVLLTTGGGLYRYDLGDEVEVAGFADACPRLRFIGRSAAVSDLVGEKLHEHHVRQSLDAVSCSTGLCCDFVLLVPVPNPRPHYCLYLADVESSVGSEQLKQLGAAVDQALAENPQYSLARRLGQLGPLTVRGLAVPAARLWAEYERLQSAGGRRAGDLKPVVLDSRREWVAVLERIGSA